MLRIGVYQTAFLGDVVLTAPFVDSLYRQYKGELEIFYIVSKGKEDVFKNDPRIKNVIIYDKRAKDKGLSGIKSLSKQLSALKLDILFNLHRSTRSHILMFFTKAKVKYSFKSIFSFIYTKTVKRNKKIHEVLRNYELLELLGNFVYEFLPNSLETKNSLYINKLSANSLSDIFLEQEFSDFKDDYIVISAGTEWQTKAWPKEYYLELIQLILNSKQLEKIKILILGSKKEKALCDFIISDSKKSLTPQLFYNNERVLNLCGKTNIKELIYLISQSKLCISNDSAAQHIAAFTDRSVLSFFGPTVQSFGYYPYTDKSIVLEDKSVECRPCGIHGTNQCKEGHFNCMKNIQPKLALEKVLELLAK